MQILKKMLDFVERAAHAKEDGFFSLLWMAGKSCEFQLDILEMSLVFQI